jgi:hypothetical protein
MPLYLDKYKEGQRQVTVIFDLLILGFVSDLPLLPTLEVF